MNQKVWFLIPARAGSKTIQKKNVRELGRKPLIKYVLDTISKISKKEQIIVSTDDDNVIAIVSEEAIVHERSSKNSGDKTTLDEVAVEVSKFLIKDHGASKEDLLITCQPTSPFLTTKTLEKAIEIHNVEKADTVLSVVDDRHLRWSIKKGKPVPLYKERVNRQEMMATYKETGGVISSRLGSILDSGTRIGQNISIVELDEKEGLDIDTFSDWALAEYWVNRLKLCIRVDGSKELGFGHLYRAIAIAQNIHSHEICFVTRCDGEYKLGYEFLKGHHFRIYTIESDEDFITKLDTIEPDIIINDILDTSTDYMSKLKEQDCFVVNFEDLGSGNRKADIVINDLYPDVYPQEDHWYGVEHSIINPNFEMIQPASELAEKVEHVLVAYGGTDPSNLTEKALKALLDINYQHKVTVVLGPGHNRYKEVEKLTKDFQGEVKLVQNVSNMAVLMKQADLALTSAGRTVTELMVMGVPTITMCQNNREMRHNHASSTFGVVNLGLGKSISVEVLSEHITMFMEDRSLRKDMVSRMKKAVSKRSNANIVTKILKVYKEQRSK